MRLRRESPTVRPKRKRLALPRPVARQMDEERLIWFGCCIGTLEHWVLSIECWALNAKYTKSQLDALRANPARLRLILMHHVLNGRLDAVSAVKMGTIHPVQGPAITTGIVDGHGTIGGARYVVTNVSASNGILHG